MKNPVYIAITCFLLTATTTFACKTCAAHNPKVEEGTASPAALSAAAGTAETQTCAQQCAAKKSAGKKAGPCAYPLTTCVVSGESLDAMGKPYVFTHGDWEIKLCCADCKEDFLADPENYLAKLKDACKANKSCSMDKSACMEGCKKPCCAKDKPGSADKKTVCKEGCTKPCCASVEPAPGDVNPSGEESAPPAVPAKA